ncbi:hypothetical protein FHW36_101205 [Chitinophaga polysaccharea]|uniref:Uncharacterized protein n=1 Tax=Chitinophaga polysaccharea TaxID=1293035 RepID=A0A561Q1P1_9BACT|nr:hypothetical protein [Chitinophaga polysaccharea]TWF44286.1 hypothetical protein FHW36_101205 [Chitinophaga polysaccharea]
MITSAASAQSIFIKGIGAASIGSTTLQVTLAVKEDIPVKKGLFKRASIFSFFFFFSLLLLISCNDYIKPTPERYKYINQHFSVKDYTEDSIAVMNTLNKALEQNIGPFSAKKAYNTKATSIYLDTMLYGPDKEGIVVFIITETDREKVEHYGNDTLKYLYGANYLFGLKDKVSKQTRLFDYGAVRFVNFHSYKTAKEVLFEYCFGRRATDKPWNDHEPMYNMDDVRFWSGDQFNAIRFDTSFIHLEE